MKYFILLILSLLNIKSFSQSPLCSSRPSSFCCEYVSSITINGKTYNGSTGFSSSSGGNPPGYYDYSFVGDEVPTISAGQQITISYTAVTNGNYMEYFKLWIDFNGNGILTDPGELVHEFNTSWLGTRTFNFTFVVPTTVFNGEVYMRFIMQFSGTPTICGTYSYGNTFDFKTNIIGAQDPFNYTGSIYGSEGIGLSNIPVHLYSKSKTENFYKFLSTHTTDSNGNFNLTSSKDVNVYDFQLRIENLNIQTPTINNAILFNEKIINQTFISKDFYRLDVNEDNNLTISDIYTLFTTISGRNMIITPYRIFTPNEWGIINSSSNNLKGIYNGTQSIILSNLPNKGNSQFYLVRTGYQN
jgi:hypothetical protein